MILFLSLATVILTIVQTFYNYRVNKNGLYLAGFLIPLSISGILHHFFLRDNSAWKLALVYGHFMPLFYLAGPMLYFYIRSTIRDNSRLSKWDYLHFLPFIISLTSIFPYYFVDFDTKLKIAERIIADPNYNRKINISWLYNNIYNLLVRPIFLFIYFLVSLFVLIRYFLANKKIVLVNKQELLMVKWMFTITIIAGICTAGYLVLTINYFDGNTTTRDSINSLTFNYITGFFFSLIPLMMIAFPQVLYGIPIAPLKEKKPILNDEKRENKSNKTVKLSVKKLEKEERQTFQKLTEMIVEYMKTEKPFTDPNYSLDDLSANLNIQKHHLYYCFNTILNSRFSTIRTQMRVEYAKECLLNGDLKTLSMEGVWTKTGFSSRTNFFVNFKEITGLTPLDFIKNNKLEEGMIQ